MPVVTHGRIGVVPVRITTELSLATILSRMQATKPVDDDLTPGWGSLGDDVSPLGRPGARTPKTGKPVQVEGDVELPERIEARAYWWEVDRDVLRFVGTNEQRTAMTLAAADVFISRVSDDELLVLISTRNQGQLTAHVKPLLDELFEDDPNQGQVSLDTSAMDERDTDFFLWILYKSQESPEVDSELTIEEMKAAHSVDGRTRATQVSRGVEMDRGEVLALIIQETMRFGPVKVLLMESGIGVRLDCEIALHGEFSIFKKETRFRALPDDVTEEYRNVLAVLYFAHQVYPRMIAAWIADRAWHDHGRADFRAECRRQMLSALTP